MRSPLFSLLYRRLFGVILITLLWGCGSEEVKPKPPHKPWAIQQKVCTTTAEKAVSQAQKQLQNRVSIIHLQKNVKVTVATQQEKWCATAYVTQEDWFLYRDVVARKYDLLAGEIYDLNGTVTLQKKDQAISDWLSKAAHFNNELNTANELATLEIALFDTNKTVLLNAIKARPSLFVLYKPCDRNSNYRCSIAFVSKATGESKLSYSWDFGDGQNASHKNPIHRYSKTGEYEVQAEVRDIYGAKSSLKLIVSVKRLSQPVAAFTFKNRIYKVGETVKFRSVSYTQKGRIKSYRWNFGDGRKAKGVNARHLYKKAGKYRVSLRVCSAKNECTVKKRMVKVVANNMVFNVKKGSMIDDYIQRTQPADKIIKKQNALMSAYRFNNVWLLVKRGKIECAVTAKGLSLNLLGQPKKCYWHEKHAKRYILQLK